jgi:hypothetical protein
MTLHVNPCYPSNNVSDELLAHAKHAPQVRLADVFIARVKAAYFQYIGVLQLCLAVRFPASHKVGTALRHIDVPPFAYAVPHVSGLRSGEKMDGSIARRVVAVMANLEALRDLAVHNLPRATMGTFRRFRSGFARSRKRSVSVFVGISVPHKARVRVPRERRVVVQGADLIFQVRKAFNFVSDARHVAQG